MKFGELCRRKRLGARLSQRNVAHLIGASQSFVNKIERGSRYPWPELAGRICKALNLTPAELGACDPLPKQTDDRVKFGNQKRPLTQEQFTRHTVKGSDDIEQSFA